jgi:hypothetical protein
MYAFIVKLYTWYQLHRLKRLGARTVHVLQEQPYDLTSVIVRSVRGYAMSFYCQKIVYTFEYENSSHHQKRVVYRLYAESHDDTMPPRLKEVLTHEVYLPRLFSFFMDETVRRKIMLDIFVSILADRFDIAQR